MANLVSFFWIRFVWILECGKILFFLNFLLLFLNFLFKNKNSNIFDFLFKNKNSNIFELKNYHPRWREPSIGNSSRPIADTNIDWTASCWEFQLTKGGGANKNTITIAHTFSKESALAMVNGGIIRCALLRNISIGSSLCA